MNAGKRKEAGETQIDSLSRAMYDSVMSDRDRCLSIYEWNRY